MALRFFFIGILAASAALVLQVLLSLLSELFFNKDLVISTAATLPFVAITIGAITEEGVRTALIWKTIINTRPIRDAYQSAILIGAGFSATEFGLYYFAQGDNFNFSITILTTVTLHLGLSLLVTSLLLTRVIPYLWVVVLLVATALHAAYNIFLF